MSTETLVTEETLSPERRDWQLILQDLQLIEEQEENAALRMGDILVEIEDSYGKEKVWEAADKLQLEKSKVKQRLWVSRKIPKGHWLRDTHLKFSHLRAIAGTEDIDTWGEKALHDKLSVSQLTEQIAQAGDTNAKLQGDPCAYVKCGQPLPEDGTIVSFRIGHEKTARCCSLACTSAHFQSLLQVAQLVGGETEGIDPYEIGAEEDEEQLVYLDEV